MAADLPAREAFSLCFVKQNVNRSLVSSVLFTDEAGLKSDSIIFTAFPGGQKKLLTA
jgi:hypothetical protein